MELQFSFPPRLSPWNGWCRLVQHREAVLHCFFFPFYFISWSFPSSWRITSTNRVTVTFIRSHCHFNINSYLAKIPSKVCVCCRKLIRLWLNIKARGRGNKPLGDWAVNALSYMGKNLIRWELPIRLKSRPIIGCTCPLELRFSGTELPLIQTYMPGRPRVKIL